MMNESTNKKAVNHSVFGMWLFSLSRINRMRMIEALENEGIQQATIRQWCYRKSLPRTNALDAVEKITGQKAEFLFPY